MYSDKFCNDRVLQVMTNYGVTVSVSSKNLRRERELLRGQPSHISMQNNNSFEEFRKRIQFKSISVILNNVSVESVCVFF